MVCPRCRTESGPDEAFCARCGRAVPAPPAGRRHAARPRVLLSAAALVAAVFAPALVAWAIQAHANTPREVAERFVAAAASGDDRAMEGLLAGTWDKRECGAVWAKVRQVVGVSPFRYGARLGRERCRPESCWLEINATSPAPPLPTRSKELRRRLLPLRTEIHLCRTPDGWRVDAGLTTAVLIDELIRQGYLQLAAAAASVPDHQKGVRLDRSPDNAPPPGPERVARQFIAADLANDPKARADLLDDSWDPARFTALWNRARRLVGGSPFRAYTIDDRPRAPAEIHHVMVMTTIDRPEAAGLTELGNRFTFNGQIDIVVAQTPAGYRVSGRYTASCIVQDLIRMGYTELQSTGDAILREFDAIESRNRAARATPGKGSGASPRT